MINRRYNSVQYNQDKCCDLNDNTPANIMNIILEAKYLEPKA